MDKALRTPFLRLLVIMLMIGLVGLPAAANADEHGSVYGNRCGDYVRTVGGVNVSRLGVKLKCPGYSRHLNGYMDSGTGEMRVYDIHRKRQGDVRHTLVHEMAHAVDFRMSDELRYVAYEQTGALRVNGSYNTNGGKVDMRAWANDPMEVYAENVAHCMIGSKKMPGIHYVNRSKCGAIMATYRKAVATGKPYRSVPAPKRAPAKPSKPSHAKKSKSSKVANKKSSKKSHNKKHKKSSKKKSHSKKSKKHSKKTYKKSHKKAHKSKKHSKKSHKAKKHTKKRKAEPRMYSLVSISYPRESKLLLTHVSHLSHASRVMAKNDAKNFGLVDPASMPIIVESPLIVETVEVA